VHVYVKHADKLGVEIEVKTWADTKLYGAGANWIAFTDD